MHLLKYILPLLLAALFLSPMAVAQETASTETAPAASTTDTEGAASPFNSPLVYLLPVAVVLVMMLVTRPQQKGQAKREEMLKQLKKNDRVVTAGGIVAKVQNVNSDQKVVKLLLDEKSGSTMTVTVDAISRVVTGNDVVGDGDKEE